MIKLLWKAVWQFLIKLNINLYFIDQNYVPHHNYIMNIMNYYYKIINLNINFPLILYMNVWSIYNQQMSIIRICKEKYKNSPIEIDNQFSREETQMANKHMKWSPCSWLGKCKLKQQNSPNHQTVRQTSGDKAIPGRRNSMCKHI